MILRLTLTLLLLGCLALLNERRGTCDTDSDCEIKYGAYDDEQ